jgi:hypothetical protein
MIESRSIFPTTSIRIQINHDFCKQDITLKECPISSRCLPRVEPFPSQTAPQITKRTTQLSSLFNLLLSTRTLKRSGEKGYTAKPLVIRRERGMCSLREPKEQG